MGIYIVLPVGLTTVREPPTAYAIQMVGKRLIICYDGYRRVPSGKVRFG